MSTLAHARSLPRSGDPVVVPPEFQDANGHMNIRHYFDLASKAIEERFEAFGVDDAYRAAGHGFFTVENGARYHSECHVGDSLSVHLEGERLSEKAVRTVAYIVNESTDQLACTFTSVAVHVDMHARRAAPMGARLLRAVAALTGG